MALDEMSLTVMKRLPVALMTCDGCGRFLLPQPERRLGRLHGLLDHSQQLGGQGVQVDLLAQPGAEGRHCLGGVVAAPVEAPVDRGLDPPAGRLEHRGHGQGRGRHHQGGIPAQQLTQPENHQGIATAQQQREQSVGERAADDAVQVIQPVAGDGG
jgi:hypothetical protein